MAVRGVSIRDMIGGGELLVTGVLSKPLHVWECMGKIYLEKSTKPTSVMLGNDSYAPLG